MGDPTTPRSNAPSWHDALDRCPRCGQPCNAAICDCGDVCIRGEEADAEPVE